eukprot:TRINITY_DN69377_c0_g1_i1.p2 TRINITY_DN69377_c0_g1~~TRINITY_DN69377_c0_g1_i1.p2  ORF type:complete len:135 (-),score=34.41 TRINITY_DN69377_c0_g1_i1:90-494(-)
MIRRPPRSTQGVSSAASDVYKRQTQSTWDDEGSLAWLYSDIGNVYFALYQYDIAEPYYQQGLQAMQKLKDKYGESVMHNNIALCQLSTGKFNESFQNLDIALKLRQEINNTYACLLYTSPSPRDLSTSRMPSSA